MCFDPIYGGLKWKLLVHVKKYPKKVKAVFKGTDELKIAKLSCLKEF